MDWLNETPTWWGVAPLLMWIKILEVLAVALLALALLTFVVGWVRHLPWWARLSAVVPLAASIGIASAIPGLHNTYVFWDTISNFCFGHGCFPNSFPHAEYVAGIAAHMAAVLGWVGIIGAGLWLVLLASVARNGVLNLGRHQ